VPRATILRAWRYLRGLARNLWERAKREPSSPRQVGLSVALGAFIACTPLLGFHLWLALGLASLLRLNRVWAMIASRLSATPILLATTFGEIEIAHRLRTGAWVAMNWHDAFAQARELVADWILGTLLVGGPIAACAGLVAFALAQRWQRLKSRAESPEPSNPAPVRRMDTLAPSRSHRPQSRSSRPTAHGDRALSPRRPEARRRLSSEFPP